MSDQPQHPIEPSPEHHKDIDEDLMRLARRMRETQPSDRAAEKGDVAVVDFQGKIDDKLFDGGAGTDVPLELGSDTFVPGFEDQLVGAKAGEEREVKVTFPADYQAEQLAGQEATFSVSVKEVREKVLPELGDDFALEQAGFDSLEELREDIRTKLREADERRVEQDFREAVVDAVVREADVEVPDALVEARARELWDRMLHTLSHQGIGKDAYLRIAGKSEEELLEEAKPDAEQALRREAVIAAIIEKEGIAPSDGDVLDALQSSAARESTTPEKLRDRLEQAGRLDELRDDLAQRMAVDWLVEQAKSIPVEQAQARDKLWTPDKDEEHRGSGRLWTPGT